MDPENSTVDNPTAAETDAPASAPVDVSAPSSGDQVNDVSSASSAPDPVETDRDGLLKVVQDAVRPKEADATAETPADDAAKDTADGKPEDQNAAPGANAEELADTPTDDELAALKPKARKRVQQLLTQRAELRGQVEAQKPEVEFAQQLKGYLTRHQLSPEDANLLLGVGAALRRGDYQAFLEGVMPYVEVARQSLGQTFAPDLQAKVEDGSMTEDAAKELTRARLEAHRARVDADTQRQERTDEQQQAHVSAVRSAVVDWETGIRSRDPDFARKEASVKRVAQGIMAEEGPPQSAAAAVQIVQRAYDEVSKLVTASVPAPKPTRQTPSAISVPSLGAAPEPRSMLEAVRLAANRTRSAGA